MNLASVVKTASAIQITSVVGFVGFIVYCNYQNKKQPKIETVTTEDYIQIWKNALQTSGWENIQTH
jgi:hypothetical protein